MSNAISQPIHAPVSRALMVAVLVVAGLLVSAMAVGIHLATDPVATTTDTIAEWGD